MLKKFLRKKMRYYMFLLCKIFCHTYVFNLWKTVTTDRAWIFDDVWIHIRVCFRIGHSNYKILDRFILKVF